MTRGKVGEDELRQRVGNVGWRENVKWYYQEGGKNIEWGMKTVGKRGEEVEIKEGGDG